MEAGPGPGTAAAAAAASGIMPALRSHLKRAAASLQPSITKRAPADVQVLREMGVIVSDWRSLDAERAALAGPGPGPKPSEREVRRKDAADVSGCMGGLFASLCVV